MNIPGLKSGSELGKDLFGIGASRAPRVVKARSRGTALLLAGAKIRRDQDMQWWMLGPILGELFDIKERHLVYYGVAVSASGGEEAIDMFPALRVSSTVH